ncbi:peptidase P60 [Mesorhizobium sp. Root552]|uniref:NlpC/P60 family protein n=1 Tax=Mesorhizobium sp. Root552 TaxID=1736555 RepID=UPI000700E123|nr:NlpC/P60 family protein [Mesorhizobium sp. Root552]KQZ16386.1 peptidase P60 [Mesorhizobium sp. Root552]
MNVAKTIGARPEADEIVAEALSWLGTPYRHQAYSKGVGCDCLGLIRGVWRSLYGDELEVPADYAPDWAEASGEERLLLGAGRNLKPKPLGAFAAGDVLVFRWRPHLPAKHAGIALSQSHFVHAYQGGGSVVKSALVSQWRRRLAGVFVFPNS